MKTGESPGKTVRRIVTVLQSNVNHLRIRRNELTAGESKSALANVFRDGKAAEQAEALLKIERRNADLPCDTVKGYFFGDAAFNIVDCPADCFHPFHGYHLLL